MKKKFLRFDDFDNEERFPSSWIMNLRYFVFEDLLVEPLQIFWGQKTKVGKYNAYKVKTIEGEFNIFPNECIALSQYKMAQYLEKIGNEEGIYLMKAGDNKAFAEQVFYMRTRGIPYLEAVKMLLSVGKAKNPNFYIRFHIAYQKEFYGVGLPAEGIGDINHFFKSYEKFLKTDNPKRLEQYQNEMKQINL